MPKPLIPNADIRKAVVVWIDQMLRESKAEQRNATPRSKDWWTIEGSIDALLKCRTVLGGRETDS